MNPVLYTTAVLAVIGAETLAAAPERFEFDCGFRGPDFWLDAIRQGVARGEIPDPRARVLPQLPPPPAQPGQPAQCLTREHIFPFEDSAGILLTDYSNAQLSNLMVEAANSLLSTHGDIYDFIGFWVNFDPHHLIGAAFYMLVSNDVLGIGNVGEVFGGGPTFDLHEDLGLAGEVIEGMVMMWNINNSSWQPGSGAGAAFTRLALGQEFEHRFALFLPPLLNGPIMQGDNGSCGRVFHWNWKVDGQGSAMEISEWVGSNPAQLAGSFVTFNTDIPGSVYSYTDLYLMGYVSPAEMDAGNSELRYMNASGCSPFYNGAISHFASADIIAAAGPRIPDHAAAQQNYRTGWIMLHQPGDPPSTAELDKAVAILEQHMIDWSTSTLGRGTMDNALFPDCNCNGVPDSSECECFGDLDGNGSVDVVDLLTMLAAWGTSPAGPPDLDGDGVVGVVDLLTLLAHFGACR